MLLHFSFSAFVPVTDLRRAGAFYGGVLGLEERDDVPGFVKVFDAGGTPLRVTKVGDHAPAPWTIAGWSVPSLTAVLEPLRAAGVTLQRYEGMTDERGVWTTPGGDRIAWFTDPDGNLLSLTEHAHRTPTRARDVTPVLPTRSVVDALTLYTRLGFRTSAFQGSADPVYGFAERDGVFLHFSRVETIDPLTSMVSVYLFVEDADALHAEWQAAVVEGRLHPPADTDYGLREGAYVDPDGNLLRFGSWLIGGAAT